MNKFKMNLTLPLAFLIIFCVSIGHAQIYQSTDDVQLKDKSKTNRLDAGHEMLIIPGDNSSETRGYLGAQVKNHNDGVIVEAFSENSAAEKAGIRIGDLILSIDHKEVNDVEMLVNLLVEFAPNDTVDITFSRDGINSMIAVKLGEAPEKMTMSITKEHDMEAYQKGTNNPLGIEVEPIELSRGVRIKSVIKDRQGDLIGLKAGDMITSINKQIVSTVEQYKKLIALKTASDLIEIRVQRGSETVTIRIEVDE